MSMKYSALIVLGICACMHAAFSALEVSETADMITIQSSGSTSTPCFKTTISRKNGGNITDLRVPCKSSRNMASGGQWPLFTVQSIGGECPCTMTKNRENYAFPVKIFEVVEASSEKVIIKVGGPSKNSHYDYIRTYTIAPAGIKMEGEITPLKSFNMLGVWSLFNSVFEYPSGSRLPVRSLGDTEWKMMSTSTSDGPRNLPSGVKYPFEAGLKLKGYPDIELRLVFEKSFEKMQEKSHNTMVYRADRNLFAMFERGTSFGKGQKQTYAMAMNFSGEYKPVTILKPADHKIVAAGNTTVLSIGIQKTSGIKNAAIDLQGRLIAAKKRAPGTKIEF